MIIDKQVFENMINSPVRSFRGRVEIFEGSTLASICRCNDRLQSFTVERIGEEGKFFGFGICQKLNVKLLDKERELNLTKNNHLEIEFGVDSDFIYPCPHFYVEEVDRDENTNALSVVAYDALYKAREHKVSELTLPTSYTIKTFAAACATLLGIPMVIDNAAANSFNLVFAQGANFEGTESIRNALDAIAEATQTIYYMNNKWELVFKRLDITGSPVATIDKTKYRTLQSKDARTLGAICHATELGDNVIASANNGGVTQYVRDNAFWELRDDVGTLVDNALAAIGGVTAHPFECDWRGNFLLEIGDKIALTTKDDNTIISFILDDTFSFDGALSGKTRWACDNNGAESATNPTSIGEAIKQTYARVNKQEKRIDIVASETTNNKEAISSLQITTDGINTTVGKIEKSTNSALNGVNEEIANLKTTLQQTEKDLKISIEEATNKNIDAVTTSTGFTFNKDGLTIEKSDSEMSTLITEDGMAVYKNSDEMLKADNQGVKALNLYATTYLIINGNSRFENYTSVHDGSKRTGCFWIGEK